MNRSGAPAYTWLYCLKYVCFILNRLIPEGLHWRTRMEACTVSTPDIRPMLRFHFRERVYYAIDSDESPGWPSDYNSKRVAYGISSSETVGHAIMTYVLLTKDTKHEIHQSRVRPCTEQSGINKRDGMTSNSASGENSPKDPVFIHSKSENENQQSFSQDSSLV